MTQYIPASCRGVTCSCGKPAYRKVGEEIFDDDPAPYRHNLTAYVCRDCFVRIMGESGVVITESYQSDMLDAIQEELKGEV